MSGDGAGTMDRVRKTADRIREEEAPDPEWAVILGAGLGRFVDEIDDGVPVPYEELPGFPPGTAGSRGGRLVLGSVDGRPVAAMSGRCHRYEGHSPGRVTFPVRVLRELGAASLVTAGAAGATNPVWEVGDLALISDHINLTGDNPLIGSNVDAQGPRFPDMSEAYDPALRRRARVAARDVGLSLREGVYVAVTGPDLATPAECRMLRTLGADLVGASAVPEVIVARHADMRVLGAAVITDTCSRDGRGSVDAEDAVRAPSGEAGPTLSRLLRAVMSAS